MKTKITFAQITDLGSRNINEDALAIFTNERKNGFILRNCFAENNGGE